MKTAIYILLLLIAGGCKKDKDKALPYFPPPSWQDETAGKYPASMTAVVQLPHQLRGKYDENDELAAFIGDECRGVAEVVEINGSHVFYLLIHGAAPEQDGIIIRYYSAKDSHVYITNTRLNFEADGIFGTADQPRTLALKSQP